VSSIGLGEDNADAIATANLASQTTGTNTETVLAGTGITQSGNTGQGQATTQPDTDSEQVSLSEDERQSIESSLEEQTDADLSREDYDVTVDEDGQLVAELSDEGRESVAVQTTPGNNLPVVGGILTTGTRIRAEYREQTQPAADAFNETVPTGTDILGLVGAAAPAAAAEPTPLGEIGLGGVVAGAAAVGVGSAVAGRVAGEDPEAQTDIAIPERDSRRQGELQPGDTNRNELEPGERQTTELEVPEERAAVAPEELGIPRDAVRDGDAEITGPEGTEITDEGDIVIPAGTTQVARGNRFEDEEEEEAEDEDEEEEEEEASEEEEVVVNVPDEFLPDEEQTIGGEGSTEPVDERETRFESEETAEDEEAEADSDEPLEEILNLPRQGTQEDDATPDETQADEDFAEEQPTEGGDATEPETPEQDEGTDSTFPGLIGGGSGATIPPILNEDQQQTQPELDAETDGQQPGQVPGQPDTDVQQPGQVPGQVSRQVPQQTQPPLTDVIGLQTPLTTQTPTAVETTTTNQTGNSPGFGNPTQTVNANELANPTEVRPPRNEPPRRQPRFPDVDGDDDDEDDELPGLAGPQLTDFRNPVTGGVLETTLTPSGEETSIDINFFSRE
jgi:hypothetical protein